MDSLTKLPMIENWFGFNFQQMVKYHRCSLRLCVFFVVVVEHTLQLIDSNDFRMDGSTYFTLELKFEYLFLKTNILWKMAIL